MPCSRVFPPKNMRTDLRSVSGYRNSSTPPAPQLDVSGFHGRRLLRNWRPLSSRSFCSPAFALPSLGPSVAATWTPDRRPGFCSYVPAFGDRGTQDGSYHLAIHRVVKLPFGLADFCWMPIICSEESS